MIPSLQEYGIILLIFAVFGYSFLDIFNVGLDWGLPNIHRSSIDKILHYTSVGIWMSTYLIMFIFLTLIAPNQDNFFSKLFHSSFEVISNTYESGIITSETYNIILQTFTFSILFAFNLTILYSLAFLFGLFIRFNATDWIKVYFKDDNRTAKFSRFISESDDFFFFGTQGNLWEAIRKDDVSRIETNKVPTKLDEWFKNIDMSEKMTQKLFRRNS